ncbi:MAG: polymer-forming cytoskeletal protein [Phycisphaerales bacterium]|nr:polymer-forming cytoskeletal protein [Phycisphaerales bacterium]
MLKRQASTSDGGRTVHCTHCGRAQEVARRAMSVFCVHCTQRLIIEDYTITSYHATRMFATCGDIVVEKSGFVSAPIRVRQLTVRGRVQGNVEARGCVRIDRTGQFRGDIVAPRLVVADGAQLNGYLRIAPSSAGDRMEERAP